MWDRSLLKIGWQSYKDKIIYVGHTATTTLGGGATPMFKNKVVGIDTGAGSGGRVTIIEAGTKNYWQST